MTLILILALLSGFGIGYWTAVKVTSFKKSSCILNQHLLTDGKKNVYLIAKQNGYEQFQSYNN